MREGMKHEETQENESFEGSLKKKECQALPDEV